ncbi:MAG TPA: formyltransferase family protein [Candidatus Hydrogenedentes bacterium]|nr:formyltransferase family protein [Candidatus Hydrogenedentota bacterium]HNT87471.1 formyltransferase family protein [Candidatus Hydrogenedentota bacterium]
MADGVVLLAGYRRAPTALALLWALKRRVAEAPPVKAVLCVNEFSPRRWRQWRRRLGPEAVGRVASALGFRTATVHDAEYATYRERLDDWNVPHRSLRRLCRELDVPLHVVPSLDSLTALRLLDQYGPRHALFTGGGILRASFLERVPGGILNVHSAWLPHVRGMNAAEWSLYYGMQPAATVHLIDRGIDTGPILARRVVDVAQGEQLGHIRARVVLAGLDLLLEVLPAFLRGEAAITANPKEQGRQYYAMAPVLRGLVQHWIDTGITPVCSPEEVAPDDPRPAPMRFVT